MICSMHRRVAQFAIWLGLAVALRSHAALAQQADSDWFDSSVPSAPPAPTAPANGAPPAAPDDGAPLQEPTFGPPGVQPVSPQAPADQAPPSAGQAPPDNAPETDPSALTEFRPTLDPYGTWVTDQQYGTVWVPNPDAVGDDFAPYVSSGHWALTADNDWTWQSDYPFGGVVFHYGRWVWVPGTGWAWVAGRRYANAWVDWRVPTDDYGYVGWAPMPPAWGWYGGSALALGFYPAAPYVFCPSGYAFSYNVHSYIVHDRYVIHDIASHTRNYSAAAGGTHIAATPRVLPANSAPPHGPSLQSAHIPASAAPASRIGGSASFSARGNLSGSQRSNPYVRGESSYGGQRSSYGASTYGSGRAAYSNPSGYSRPSSYGNASPSYSRPSNYDRAAPQRYYSAPSAASRAPYAPPTAAAQPYSAPSTRYYSGASTHYSAPARSYSAPARSYSAPARSYSAPSVHSSHSRR
jgi:hypothetical protein